MKFTVQVLIEADQDAPPLLKEVFAFERGGLGPANVGLALAEAKDLLGKIQETVVTEQVKEALETEAPCPTCGRRRRHKDTRGIVLRSLFGTLHVRSPRWFHCSCRPAETRTFTPLATLLPERATPELVYLESKFAGLVSYDASASCYPRCSRSAASSMPPPSAGIPSPSPSTWTPSLAKSSPPSLRAVPGTGPSWAAPTCPSWSASTVASSTPAVRPVAVTGGSR